MKAAPTPIAPKYLIYQSDSKVAMLGAQLEPDRIKWELAASARVPGIQVSAKRIRPAKSRSRKLEAVVQQLDERGLIGSIDEPKPYFRGEMDLSWGAFGGHWSPGGLVFFCGMHKTTLVGLGGSEAHVIKPNPEALPPGRSVFTPNSYTPYIMDVLSREFPVDMAHAGLYPSKSVDEAVAHCMVAVMAAYKDRHRPPERLEFVAKRLLHWASDHRWDYIGHHDQQRLFDDMTDVLLGTPIYVAMVD